MELQALNPVPDEVQRFAKKVGLDALDAVYTCTLSHLHVFALKDNLRIWLVDGIGRVTSNDLMPLTSQEPFKSRRKLLRILVEMNYPDAIALQRQDKITKLLP